MFRSLKLRKYILQRNFSSEFSQIFQSSFSYTFFRATASVEENTLVAAECVS